MIDQELLDILVCPEDKSELRLATETEVAAINERVRVGTQKNRSGATVSEPIDGGLIRADERFLYAIRDEIPIMLIDEALPMVDSSQD